MPELTRRQLLGSLSALATLLTPSLRGSKAQARLPQIAARSLNHFEIAVSDPERTIDFYQGLFGMPIQARSATATALRVGRGPQFLSIRRAEGDVPPRITRYGLGVERFSVDRIVAVLTAHGIEMANTVGPMKAEVLTRDGTAAVAFGDPDGIVCQLHDVSFCAGGGPLGNRCPEPVPARKGSIALTDVSHLTIFASDAQRSNAFYRSLFGFSTRSFQGPTSPTLAVGPAAQFLMFAGGGAARGGPTERSRASINHACWSLDDFVPDRVQKTLEDYGLKPRESAAAPAAPLRYYITMRMENRGGAPGGTPEFYFTDPDGLLMQLQDSSYCGGSGFLGNDCPKV